MKKKSPTRGKQTVLNGYQRVGNTFVPPMLHQLGPMDYISWSTQTLPQLVWWDVLMDRVSLRFAARVAEQIAKYFKSKACYEHWWAFIGDYADLSEEGLGGLKEHLEKAGVFGALSEALSGFLALYPDCPIAKLTGQPSNAPHTKYLDRFERRLAELQNKRSRNAVLVQAQVVYMGFLIGKLRVKKGLALGDFEQVQFYPDTERSTEVGASICAAVNMLAGSRLPKYPDDAWAQYFWRRSFELRPPDFACLGGQ